MNQSNSSHGNPPDNAVTAVTTFMSKSKLYSTVLIILLFIIAALLGYMLLRETMSEQAKQLAEASKLMSESLKANSETLAPVPSIVKGFSDLIDDRVSIIFQQRSGQLSENADKRVEDALKKVKESEMKIESTSEEIRLLSIELNNIKKKADQSLSGLEDKAKQLSLLFPDVDKYKNIVDSEYLISMLAQKEDWNAGADIVVRFENLVSGSKDSPEKLPAKYIEHVGDWCRKMNQNQLALWFYESAVERDPERLSAVVELHSLRSEVLPTKREEALRKLNELARSGKLEFDEVIRIFNVFIELKKYKELSELISQLESIEKYSKDPINFASMLRNRAVSLEEHLGYKSPEAWAALEKAVSLSQDENVLKIYARWLYETKKYEEARESLIILLGMDHRDSRYYITLAKTYLEQNEIEKAQKVVSLAEKFVVDQSGKIEVDLFKANLPIGNASTIKKYLDGAALTKP